MSGANGSAGASDGSKAASEDLLRPLHDIGSINRYKGWLSVNTKALVLPSGELWEYDVVKLNSDQGVAILPFLDRDTVLLCKQYRPAVGSVLLELIQGGVFKKEQPAAAAARELREETGYRGQLRLLYDNLVPLAGSVDHRMTVYAATSLEKICEPTAHEKERLVLVEKKWGTLLEEIYDGTHKDLLLNFAVLYLEARCGAGNSTTGNNGAGNTAGNDARQAQPSSQAPLHAYNARPQEHAQPKPVLPSTLGPNADAAVLDTPAKIQQAGQETEDAARKAGERYKRRSVSDGAVLDS